MPWHNQRDGIVEFANWLSGVSGILGRSAGEILLLAQTEVGEGKLRGAGGSSAMPQKANPVLAEAVLALARRNAGLVGGVHQAALHMHERDGTAWNLEWLTLPDMIRTTGAGLHHAEVMVQNLDVYADRMAANLSPATLAEAAVYALAEHMPKSEAQALVKAARVCSSARESFSPDSSKNLRVRPKSRNQVLGAPSSERRARKSITGWSDAGTGGRSWASRSLRKGRQILTIQCQNWH